MKGDETMAELLGMMGGWLLLMAIVYGAKAFWKSVTGNKDDKPEDQNPE